MSADASLSSDGQRGRSWLAFPYLLAAGVLDAAIVCMAWEGRLGLNGALAAHLGLSFALLAALLAARLPGHDPAQAINAGLAFATLGPVGGFTAALIVLLLPGKSSASSRRAEWYRRLLHEDNEDRPHAMHIKIVEGRAYHPNLAPPSFSRVLVEGTTAQKQVVLGLLSRHFHPDHRPLLEVALHSHEAAVRVSAAAVYVKVREDMRARVAKLTTSEMAGGIEAAKDLANCAGAGILDEAEARTARAAALRYLRCARPAPTEMDGTEEIFCRLLADSGLADEVSERLMPHAGALTPPLRSILAQALTVTDRHRELPWVYGARRDAWPDHSAGAAR
jgi:hypothetical protein